MCKRSSAICPSARLIEVNSSLIRTRPYGRSSIAGMKATALCAIFSEERWRKVEELA